MTTVPAYFGLADARVKLRVLRAIQTRSIAVSECTSLYSRRLALALEAERTHYRTIKSTYQPPTP